MPSEEYWPRLYTQKILYDFPSWVVLPESETGRGLLSTKVVEGAGGSLFLTVTLLRVWKVAPKRCPKMYCFTDGQMVPQGHRFGVTYIFWVHPLSTRNLHACHISFKDMPCMPYVYRICQQLRLGEWQDSSWQLTQSLERRSLTHCGHCKWMACSITTHT